MTDPPIRKVVPVTDEDVPKTLHEALSEAVQGEVRGVVVLLFYHDGHRMEHMSAGDMSLPDVFYLFDLWRFDQQLAHAGLK